MYYEVPRKSDGWMFIRWVGVCYIACVGQNLLVVLKAQLVPLLSPLLFLILRFAKT